MLLRVVSYRYAEISDVLVAYIFSPDDGSSNNICNIIHVARDYRAKYSGIL
jgi:hypothetical protein